MREIGALKPRRADRSHDIALIRLSEVRRERPARTSATALSMAGRVNTALRDSSFVGDFRRPCFMTAPYESLGAPCGSL
jgi:hypothetical protein